MELRERKKSHQNMKGQDQIVEEKHWLLGRSGCTVGRLFPSDIAGLLCQRTFVRTVVLNIPWFRRKFIEGRKLCATCQRSVRYRSSQF